MILSPKWKLRQDLLHHIFNQENCSVSFATLSPLQQKVVQSECNILSTVSREGIEWKYHYFDHDESTGKVSTTRLDTVMHIALDKRPLLGIFLLHTLQVRKDWPRLLYLTAGGGLNGPRVNRYLKERLTFTLDPNDALDIVHEMGDITVVTIPPNNEEKEDISIEFVSLNGSRPDVGNYASAFCNHEGLTKQTHAVLRVVDLCRQCCDGYVSKVVVQNVAQSVFRQYKIDMSVINDVLKQYYRKDDLKYILLPNPDSILLEDQSLFVQTMRVFYCTDFQICTRLTRNFCESERMANPNNETNIQIQRLQRIIDNLKSSNCKLENKLDIAADEKQTLKDLTSDYEEKWQVYSEEMNTAFRRDDKLRNDLNDARAEARYLDQQLSDKGQQLRDTYEQLNTLRNARTNHVHSNSHNTYNQKSYNTYNSNSESVFSTWKFRGNGYGYGNNNANDDGINTFISGFPTCVKREEAIVFLITRIGIEVDEGQTSRLDHSTNWAFFKKLRMRDTATARQCITDRYVTVTAMGVEVFLDFQIYKNGKNNKNV